MEIQAVVHVTIELDDRDESTFREAVARRLSRGAEPDEFERAVTATAEGALSAVLGSTGLGDAVAAHLADLPWLRQTGVSCSPSEMIREPENQVEALRRLGLLGDRE